MDRTVKCNPSCFLKPLQFQISNEADSHFMDLLQTLSQHSAFEECGDIKAVKNPMEDRSLCFFKCVSERIGVIDSTGNVHKSTLSYLPLSPAMKDKLLNCIEGVTTIKTCRDMRKIVSCLPM